MFLSEDGIYSAICAPRKRFCKLSLAKEMRVSGQMSLHFNYLLRSKSLRKHLGVEALKRTLVQKTERNMNSSKTQAIFSQDKICFLVIFRRKKIEVMFSIQYESFFPFPGITHDKQTFRILADFI